MGLLDLLLSLGKAPEEGLGVLKATAAWLRRVLSFGCKSTAGPALLCLLTDPRGRVTPDPGGRGEGERGTTPY